MTDRDLKMSRWIVLLMMMTLTAVAVQANDWSAGVSYEYDGSGNIRRIGTDFHVYDAVSRLVRSDTNGVTRYYQYDAYGNRQPCATVTTECPWAWSVNAATNRISGVPYDAAGNLQSFEGHSYTYDALNMQTRDVAGSVVREYIYTADDERIAVYVPTNGSWRWTLREASGKVLRELTSRDPTSGTLGTASWTWVRDYVYRDGLLLASRQIDPATAAVTTHRYHLDHLGTPGRVTDSTNLLVGQHSYHAFGQEASAGRIDEPSSSPLRYTGHERDVELDYMHARYYDADTGRFLSVDPKYDEDVQFRPQKWNRYSYAANNPIRYIDPDGRGIYDFIEGAANGWSSSNLGNINRVNPRNLDYKRGQMVGDAVAAIQGFYEMAVGGQAAVGGGGATLLTAGAASPVSVPVAAGGVIVAVHGGVVAGTALNNLASANRGSSSGSGDTPTEVTPSTNKDAFTGMRGRDAKVNKETGEVWVRDRLHKDHWEVYKNQKDYEKGNRVRSVWDDGRLKETY